MKVTQTSVQPSSLGFLLIPVEEPDILTQGNAIKDARYLPQINMTLPTLCQCKKPMAYDDHVTLHTPNSCYLG